MQLTMFIIQTENAYGWKSDSKTSWTSTWRLNLLHHKRSKNKQTFVIIIQTCNGIRNSYETCHNLTETNPVTYIVLNWFKQNNLITWNQFSGNAEPKKERTSEPWHLTHLMRTPWSLKNCTKHMKPNNKNYRLQNSLTQNSIGISRRVRLKVCSST